MNDEEKEVVIKLEEAYDKLQPIMTQLRESLDLFKEKYVDYIALRDFYGSSEWFEWREKPSEGLKSGILSEDQLYDLIIEHNELLGDFLTFSAEMYKHI